MSEIQLDKAEEIAVEFIQKIDDLVYNIMVCGSIRRKRSVVHDIDLVIVPKSRFMFNTELKKRFYNSIKKQGEKLTELEYEGVQVDIYLANNDTFETLKLIRTGEIR